MKKIGTFTASRYLGAKVYEFADAGGSIYMVEFGGILFPKKFYWLADAWNCIEEHRVHQVRKFTPIR